MWRATALRLMVLLGAALAPSPRADVPSGTCPARPAFPCSLPLVGRAVAVDERAGRAYVAEDQGTDVDVLDARTGALLRTLAHPGLPTAIAVDPARGHVFIANVEGDDYAVYMFDGRTAALLRKTDVDPTAAGKEPLALAADPANGRVYALLASPYDKNLQPVGPASVAVLDGATGALRKSVDLGDTLTLGGPTGIAVDARAHRLIALTDTKVVVLDTTHL